MVGLGRINNNVFKPYPDTIMSKVDLANSFEDGIHYIDYSLITPKKRSEDGNAKNSSEYFCFTLLTETVLSLEIFKKRVSDLKQENLPYHKLTNTCAHAGYEVIAGKKAADKRSTQTAFKRGFFDIIKNDEAFKTNLQNAFLESGLDAMGNELGREYLSKYLIKKI